jgi:molybdenum-dependent DNA-binding transcriptional regulator ModE
MAKPARMGRRSAKAGGPPGSAAVLYLRVDFGEHGALGPGKTRLMELIAETGSISAAGRAMGMSYRRAWLLVGRYRRIERRATAAGRKDLAALAAALTQAPAA